MRALGLNATSASQVRVVRRHAERLKLDASHFRGKRRWSDAQLRQAVIESRSWQYLRVGAGTLAATWFALRGCAVSLPIEPTRYDLLAHTPEGIRRVQVKTTTCNSKDGWTASVGHHPDTHSKKGHRLAYDPDEIDLFFIVDGNMTMYLIPSGAIAGRVGILLRTYRKYIVGNAWGLLGTGEDAGEAGMRASA